MDTDTYVQDALDLVNHRLGSLDEVSTLLANRPALRARLSPNDLEPLRRSQAQLASIVDSSAAGDDAAVVSQLNALLDEYPIRPQIAGHDAQSWHLHVSDADTSVAGFVIGEALFGLTLLATTLGPTRLGRCAAPACDRGYLDTSPNRSRRFCGTRCATRVNVAAYRERRRRDSFAARPIAGTR